jgi:hypothetical protein
VVFGSDRKHQQCFTRMSRRFESSTARPRKPWSYMAWQIVPSPHPASNTPVILYAVDCVSSAWCMAGGQGETGALIEHWNGRAWTIMGHPSVAAETATVWGVSCVSRTACVVVGYDVPLAESWNGKVWSPMSTLDGLGLGAERERRALVGVTGIRV